MIIPEHEDAKYSDPDDPEDTWKQVYRSYGVNPNQLTGSDLESSIEEHQSICEESIEIIVKKSTQTVFDVKWEKKFAKKDTSTEWADKYKPDRKQNSGKDASWS